MRHERISWLRRWRTARRLRSLCVPWTQRDWNRLAQIWRPGKPSGIDFLVWEAELEEESIDN